MGKRILSLLLALCLVMGAVPLTHARAASSGKRTVVYIPLDDRPFNDQRVKDVAAALNIELIMPDRDLYATKLDGQSRNANGTQAGSRPELVTWLKQMDQKYDTFILSLDQLLSGGLMNSRCMADMKPLQFSDGSTMTEKDVIDYLATLSKKNNVYIIDSVMRLATSVGYASYNLEDYQNFRAYGMVARPKLSGSNLQVDNIIANYPYAADGSTMAYRKAGLSKASRNALLSGMSASRKEVISQVVLDAYLSREETVDPETVDSEITEGSVEAPMVEASNSMLSIYLKIRARKLQLTDYAMRKLCGSAHYLLGVDDSSEGNNILTNEMALLRRRLSGSDDQIFSGLDGLGQVALSKAFFEKYPLKSPRVRVTYLGDMRDQVLSFNCFTVKENVDQPLSYYGAKQTQTNPDLSLVVVTDAAASSGRAKLTYDLVSLLNENEANQIPTMLVNLTTANTKSMIAAMADDTHLGMLLSYSGPIEVPNGIVMGVSQGLARYKVLKTAALQTSATQKAHLVNLSTALVKDLGLRNGTNNTMKNKVVSYGLNPSNFASASAARQKSIQTGLKNTLTRNASGVLQSLNKSNFILSLSPYTTGRISNVTIQSCSYPWLRTSEVDLTLTAGWSAKPRALGTFHPAFADGISDTKFKPTEEITREAAVVMLVRAAGIPVDLKATGRPKDISKWAWPYVAAAVKKGYVKGYTNGSFNGSGKITRAEIVSLVVQYASVEGIALKAKRSVSFPDVSKSDWYYANVMKLARAGIINGYSSGKFRPNKNTPRAEAVRLFCVFFGRTEKLPASMQSLKRFSDVSSDQWYYRCIQDASVSHFG